MTVLVALIDKELRALRRDIHGLLVLFAMPALFVLIMSLALKDVFSERVNANLAFAVVDLDQTALSGAVVDDLRRHGYQYQSSAEDALPRLRERVRRGELSFALLIDKGFEEAQTHFESAPPRPPLTLLVDPALNAAAQAMFRSAVFEALSRQKLENMLLAMGLSREAAKKEALAQFSRVLDDSTLKVETVTEQDGPKPTSVQQSVPAWLVFSMFFVVIPIATVFIRERELGTLARLSTMRVTPRSILLGKLVPFFAINQLQAVVMVLVGMYLVPLFGGDALQLGPSLGGLWLVSAATSIAAIGFALLIAVLVRTTEQATTLGGVSNIIMGALGGIMVPKFTMPGFMQPVTDLSPMAWALDGFLVALVRQGGVAEVLPQAAALTLFGAVMLLLAGLFYRR